VPAQGFELPAAQSVEDKQSELTSFMHRLGVRRPAPLLNFGREFEKTKLPGARFAEDGPDYSPLLLPAPTAAKSRGTSEAICVVPVARLHPDVDSCVFAVPMAASDFFMPNFDGPVFRVFPGVVHARMTPNEVEPRSSAPQLSVLLVEVSLALARKTHAPSAGSSLVMGFGRGHYAADFQQLPVAKELVSLAQSGFVGTDSTFDQISPLTQRVWTLAKSGADLKMSPRNPMISRSSQDVLPKHLAQRVRHVVDELSPKLQDRTSSGGLSIIVPKAVVDRFRFPPPMAPAPRMTKPNICMRGDPRAAPPMPAAPRVSLPTLTPRGASVPEPTRLFERMVRNLDKQR